MRLFIEPCDVLLFRDGKPFSAGDDHFARSLFPPLPRTFQGAVRAAVLARYGFDAAAAAPVIGDSDSCGSIKQMLGPFIARMDNGNVTELFPLPLDLGLSKINDSGRDHAVPPVRLKPRQLPGISTDLNLACLPWAATAARLETPRAYLDLDALAAHLAGEPLPDRSPVPEGDMVRVEVRTGIRRSHARHAAEEGQLYSVAFRRLQQNYGFTFDNDGIDGELADEGMLVLGGESRPARYRRIDARPSFPPNMLKAIRKSISEKRAFRLYLATPAIFGRGWLPQAIDAAAGYAGNLRGVPVKLVSAALGRYLPAGGWELRPSDGRAQQPRAIQRAVPAGSVYWFRTEAGADEVLEKLHFKCISDIDSQLGYGLSLIGGSD